MNKSETNKPLDSWDGFLGSNFLKTDDVADENDIFVCIDIEMDTENERPMIILEKDEVKYKFSLNVTNSCFLKNDAKILKPNDVVGKKIFFTKSMAYSPTAKKQVETLRICKV